MPNLQYNYGMAKNEYAQLRIWRSTLRKLKLSSALTGEKIIELVDRWASEELQKQGYENRQDLQIQALPSEKE
jgi:hypothetical protein